MNRDVVRKLGSEESLKNTFNSMFDGITDSDTMELIMAFQSGNLKDYKRKLAVAKRKYQYNNLQLVFTVDGLPEWT